MSAEGLDEVPDDGVGAALPRVEDERFVTGRARYTDDLAVPGAAHVAFVRSPYANADVLEVDAGAARAVDGVVAVLTAADMAAADRPAPRRFAVIPGPGVTTDERLNRPAIADGRVRHDGEIVAVVVAEDRYVARDAADAVDVSYDRREAAVTLDDALAPDAPAVHDAAPDNVAFEWELGDAAGMDAIIDDAAHVVSVGIGNQRVVQNPIEPRAAIAEPDPTTGDLTFTGTTQIPHKLKRDLAAALGHPEGRIRVVAPDMGGGFGSRCVPYPEEALVAWTALHLGRPVRWQGARSANYRTDVQGRGVETAGTLALDDDGRMLGLRIDLTDDMGAYLSAFAPGIAVTATNVMTGLYDLPAVHYRVRGVMTNTAPSDAYRGVIETELIHTLERLVDRGARAAGLDPAEVRRRNFVPADAFPYETASGAIYDSGDYEPALDRALELAGYEELRERQAALREEGRYLGVGVAAWIEKCGFGCGGPVASWEYSNLRVHPSGEVTVHVGTSNHGQGHETTYAQVVASALGVPTSDVHIVEDDTGRVQEGVGTFASRCAISAGGSITESAESVLEKARGLAAHRLEADPQDLSYDRGRFAVAGAPDRSVSLAELAEVARVGHDLPEGFEAGLEATSYYDPPDYSFPFGIQIAVVEVDPETGGIEWERFVSVDDCGVQINPTIVEGQIHGGVAQGIGQALLEGAVYDDTGSLVTATHMDYALPRAHQLPSMVTDYTVTPNPNNPLGVKGVGESGAVGGLAAAVTAVEDALAPLGVDDMTPPFDAETVWRAVSDAAPEG